MNKVIGMDNYTLYQFDYRGKCIKSLESHGKGMLGLWAMQNTNGKKMTLIINDTTGLTVAVYEGRGKDSMPKITTDRDKIDAMGIEFKAV